MTGYVDLQVNGYAGVDFNAQDLVAEDLAKACERLRDHDVDFVLATLITDSVDRLCERMQVIATARAEHPIVRDVIPGIHLEGPFLSEKPGFIGTHAPEHSMPADLESMKRMFDASAGLLKIVTLAPERDVDFSVTRWLAGRGVTVSGGHCDPSLCELQGSIDAGLSMFTHLGNACPLELHRHDNIIQRVLHLSDRLSIGFIADGIHVPFFALKNYLQLIGIERAFIVTDAISAAGCGPGNYELNGQQVVVDENLATWSTDKSHLMGAAMTMPRVAENLRGKLGMTEEEVRQLTRENPLRCITQSDTD